ncbi:MAG: hypothetical protein ACODAC_06505 [Pseudomonadota bacterium]
MGIVRAALVTTLSLAVSSTALAGAIVSGDGNETCWQAAGPECTARQISLHHEWQGNDPNGQGAAWISYADTGAQGNTLTPRGIGQPGIAGHDGSPGVPHLGVHESLGPVSIGDRLVLDLWADDTARVTLRYREGAASSGGVASQLLAPNFSQDVCADGPGGCEPEDRAHLTYTFTGNDLRLAGPNAFYLEFLTYQVGTGTTNPSNPFGLLYSGRIESGGDAIAVAEPPSLGLLAGAGLVSLVVIRRRRPM